MTAQPTRRDLLLAASVTASAAASSALSGCSRPAQPRPVHRVSIVKAAHYSADLFDVVKRILVEHGVAVRGKRVLLKPNLVEFSPSGPVNTNPVFVGAVAAAFLDRGAGEVRIAEGPGHRRTTMDLAQTAGFFEAVPNFERRFVDLNLDDVSRVALRKPFSTLRKLYLPNTALGADLLVSLPKMKTHHWAGATLSMKNLFGLVPGSVYGWPKNVLHWAGIDESIADLNHLFPRQFCVVDGIVGMQGNGPILGTAKHAGVVVAGADPVSVDATCARVMGIDPLKLKYIRLAASRSGWQPGDVRQIGESIPSVATPFDLVEEFQSYRIDSRDLT
jgi:uncharacterized protein (DUF362 family)